VSDREDLIGRLRSCPHNSPADVLIRKATGSCPTDSCILANEAADYLTSNDGTYGLGEPNDIILYQLQLLSRKPLEVLSDVAHRAQLCAMNQKHSTPHERYFQALGSAAKALVEAQHEIMKQRAAVSKDD
jgi:hypothetical protein